MTTLRIDHEKCTECRMCLIACEEIGINAVYLELEPRHRHEIDVHKCTYPGCVVCLMYCPAPGSIVEAETGAPWCHLHPTCGVIGRRSGSGTPLPSSLGDQPPRPV